LSKEIRASAAAKQLKIPVDTLYTYSDRGSQYIGEDFRKEISKQGIQQSVNRQRVDAMTTPSVKACGGKVRLKF